MAKKKLPPPQRLGDLLIGVKLGNVAPEEAHRMIQMWSDSGFPADSLSLDMGRETRTGFPEAVFGQGKTPRQLVAAFGGLLDVNGKALATRCEAKGLTALGRAFPGIMVDRVAGVAWQWLAAPPPPPRPTVVSVVAAGSSDCSVAEEAALTLEFAGCPVNRMYDVGVAGIHRLLSRLDLIRQSSVVIVVAGMEGALPSVVGGLVAAPVIAVPTSVGYGASLGGMAALLGMLNTCAAGVTVVNIDNGFGAAVAALRIAQGGVRE